MTRTVRITLEIDPTTHNRADTPLGAIESVGAGMASLAASIGISTATISCEESTKPWPFGADRETQPDISVVVTDDDGEI